MVRYLKRVLICLSAVALLLSILLLPGLPWSARYRHTAHKAIVKTKLKLAEWRGAKPRLLEITGKAGSPGMQVQAVDSRYGWANLSDKEGRFSVPDVMWYPDASYDLLLSEDGRTGKIIHVDAPEKFPDNGVFDVGELDLSRGREVNLSTLPGINSLSYETYDAANRQYYKDLFETITAGKTSDAEKIEAVNKYVALKLNYDESQWELGSPRRVLERGSQYCGHLSLVMATLLETANYKARRIDLAEDLTPKNTHAVLEVFYDGAWHMYDPTFGVEYRDKDGRVLSYKEVRLNMNLISEDVFAQFKPKRRTELVAFMLAVYGSGYHHFYYIRNAS